MALYDNKHWLLSHIRNSFIISDETGLSEVAMGGENIARQLNVTPYERYPGIEESDDEDEADLLSQSYDLHSDLDFGRPRRYRSNTAVRLQKMEEERRVAATTRHVRWEKSHVALTAEERAKLFQRKDFRSSNNAKGKPQSLLSEMMKSNPTLPPNPFREFAKFDGDSQRGPGVRCFRIWLTMLKGEKRNFPMKVTVMASARVLDLIGLVCWRCLAEFSREETALKESVDYYTLHIAEDDGEVDWDFPCLDNRESVTKFTFNFLALVERDPKKEPPDRHDTSEVIISPDEPQPPTRSRARTAEMAERRRLAEIDARLRAPIYEPFKVYTVKFRIKTEVHLGVSGEKLEIYPVVHPRFSSLVPGRQKAVTLDMDSVVTCDLTDTKSHSRTSFRLVYDPSSPGTNSLPCFKHYDFEAPLDVASSVVQKINYILDMKPSASRLDRYRMLCSRKGHRRKNSFHLSPR